MEQDFYMSHRAEGEMSYSCSEAERLEKLRWEVNLLAKASRFFSWGDENHRAGVFGRGGSMPAFSPLRRSRAAARLHG